ncbi:rCG34254, isoform CRA_a [Rattus norvegicus]|uniref:RCG34254, isoform CRA_a n=1 Tax=Rattus norvegicus TaxID=10116 RepID=A6HDT1_RAT|nr:rCG34254, isoform CRA_a [Rattus norvegicus]
MSKGLLLLWLVMELWLLCLTPAASEDTIIGFLGQSVTLPCQYSSWSQSRNSMCWGRGSCPGSKCNGELLRTDGTRTISRKSGKYTLWGSIRLGDVSLTISNTNQDDSGVYCCRIEVPGWFNDVKKTVRLELRRALTATTRRESSKKTGELYKIEDRQTNILIIACCVGFVLMVLLFLAFLLRGKVGRAR